MWIKGLVVNHNWLGETCWVTLETGKGEKQIQIPASFLVGFEIVPGEEWSFECTDGGRAKNLRNLTNGERRPEK